MTRAELVSLLARDFVGAVPAAEIDRLHAAVQRSLADPAWRAGQVELFRDARAVHGLGWWEERAAEGTAPWRDLDFAAMLLLTDPRLDPRPLPRLYNPLAYIGRWRDGTAHTQADGAAACVLQSDGAVAGDPACAGWTWRVHAGQHDELWLGPAGDPRRIAWLVVGRAEDTLHLEAPDRDESRTWHRV